MAKNEKAASSKGQGSRVEGKAQAEQIILTARVPSAAAVSGKSIGGTISDNESQGPANDVCISIRHVKDAWSASQDLIHCVTDVIDLAWRIGITRRGQYLCLPSAVPNFDEGIDFCALTHPGWTNGDSDTDEGEVVKSGSLWESTWTDSPRISFFEDTAYKARVQIPGYRTGITTFLQGPFASVLLASATAFAQLYYHNDYEINLDIDADENADGISDCEIPKCLASLNNALRRWGALVRDHNYYRPQAAGYVLSNLVAPTLDSIEQVARNLLLELAPSATSEYFAGLDGQSLAYENAPGTFVGDLPPAIARIHSVNATLRVVRDTLDEINGSTMRYTDSTDESASKVADNPPKPSKK